MICCARTNCYRGGNGQNDESDDPGRDSGEIAAAVSEGGAGAQAQAFGPSAGVDGLSPQVVDSGFASPAAGADAVDQYGTAGELRAPGVAALAAADLAGD